MRRRTGDEQTARLNEEIAAYFSHTHPSATIDAVSVANDARHGINLLMGDGWLFYKTYWLALTPQSLLIVRVSSWSNRKPRPSTLREFHWDQICSKKVRRSNLALSIWLDGPALAKDAAPSVSLGIRRINFEWPWSEAGSQLAARLLPCAAGEPTS